MKKILFIVLCAVGLASCGSSHKSVTKTAVAESTDSNTIRVVVVTKNEVEQKNDSTTRIVQIEETEVYDTEHLNTDGTAPLKQRSRKVTMNDTRVSNESSEYTEDKVEEEHTEVSHSKESTSVERERVIEEAKQANRTVRWWILVAGVVLAVCLYIERKIKD